MRFASHVSDVLLSPLNSRQRVFWLYLLPSALIAYLIHRKTRNSGAETTFLG